VAQKPAVRRTTAARPEDLPAIESWGEVPEFKTEREEADFWASHSLGKSILDQTTEEDPDLI
jgi:hypothetical protein